MSFFTRVGRPPTAAEPSTAEPSTAEPSAADDAGSAGGRGRTRRVAGLVITVLACLLVLFALNAPNEIERLTPLSFLRVPVEGLLLMALALILPARPRKVVAVLVGVLLGLLVILKLFDMGFFAILGRPFDLVLDWPLFESALDFVGSSYGQAGALGVVVGAGLLAVAALVLMTLSTLRLTRLVVRHDTAATRAVAVLAVVAVGCAAFGVPIVPENSLSTVAHDRVFQIRDGLQDQEVFAKEASGDPFQDAPGEELLTALRGKDVVIAFVESYGRDAVEDPEFTSSIGPLLDDGARRLRADGYTSRSGFLTSPTAGGNSWLAHATLQSGLWINNQQRYRNLVTSDRLTISTAFERTAAWRTVGVMPAHSQPWPEGSEFYGYDEIYDTRNLGYLGPKFGFAPIPDQYTLSAFERSERAAAGRAPVMAEIALVTSHGPWNPTPRLIDWDDVDNGPAFAGMVRTGAKSDDDARSRAEVRRDYRTSIQYTLSTVISYLENYGDDDLVFIFVGDHQPAPIVTGAGASRDVPISIVTRDQGVLDRIAGWEWEEGLWPGPAAPVWRMDTFRDRFLTTFGP